jgi:hypothetical protein
MLTPELFWRISTLLSFTASQAGSVTALLLLVMRRVMSAPA